MKTKAIVVALLLCVSISLAAAEKLGVFFDVKRYLDKNKNTRFEIDYQVPYKNLQFMTRNKVFFAELKATVSISNQDSVIVKKEFVNNIGVSNKYDITNSSKTYLDRIVMTLAKPGLKIKVLLEDINGQKSADWEYEILLLEKTALMSDLELLSRITADSLGNNVKFRKTNQLYYVPNPSGIVSKDIVDSFFVRLETYLPSDIEGEASITILKGDQQLLIQTKKIMGIGDGLPVDFGISVRDLNPGKYTCSANLKTAEHQETRSMDFIITEQTEQLTFLFAEPDDDYQLLKYLVSIKNQSGWQSMSKEAKRRYVSQVWETLAVKTKQDLNDVLKKYRERIDYTNRYYSHFEPGWKTDMGRIYIRNGAPDELVKDTTGDDARLGTRDYQIWSYSSGDAPTYIFIDLQMNGNNELIYVKNDDNEKTYPDWKKYMGTEFDEDRLTKKQWDW